MKKKLITLIVSVISLYAMAQSPVLHDKAMEFSQKGEIYLLEKEYEKALKSFQKALEITPDMLSALRGQGVSYELLGLYGEAALSYATIIHNNPSYSRTIYYEHANMLLKSGNYKDALTAFEKYGTIVKCPKQSLNIEVLKKKI